MPKLNDFLEVTQGTSLRQFFPGTCEALSLILSTKITKELNKQKLFYKLQERLIYILEKTICTFPAARMVGEAHTLTYLSGKSH